MEGEPVAEEVHRDRARAVAVEVEDAQDVSHLPGVRRQEAAGAEDRAPARRAAGAAQAEGGGRRRRRAEEVAAGCVTGHASDFITRPRGVTGYASLYFFGRWLKESTRLRMRMAEGVTSTSSSSLMNSSACSRFSWRWGVSRM